MSQMRYHQDSGIQHETIGMHAFARAWKILAEHRGLGEQGHYIFEIPTRLSTPQDGSQDVDEAAQRRAPGWAIPCVNEE
jgi:hypothetical protein